MTCSLRTGGGVGRGEGSSLASGHPINRKGRETLEARLRVGVGQSEGAKAGWAADRFRLPTRVDLEVPHRGGYRRPLAVVENDQAPSGGPPRSTDHVRTGGREYQVPRRDVPSFDGFLVAWATGWLDRSYSNRPEREENPRASRRLPRRGADLPHRRPQTTAAAGLCIPAPSARARPALCHPITYEAPPRRAGLLTASKDLGGGCDQGPYGRQRR